MRDRNCPETVGPQRVNPTTPPAFFFKMLYSRCCISDELKGCAFPGVCENAHHRFARVPERVARLRLGVEVQAEPGTQPEGHVGNEIGTGFVTRSVVDSQSRTKVWEE